jgi:hypothetical protein
MPRVVPLLLVALVLLAGCTAAPGAQTTSEPTTASPSPGASTTPSVPNGTVAPGVTNDGVENASALLEAHESALRERGFELAVERTMGAGNQTVEIRQRHRVAPNVRQVRTNATSRIAGDRTSYRSWINETMTRMITQTVAGDETRYRVPPVGPAGETGRERRHRRIVETDQTEELLRGGEFEVTGVTTDGPRLYTLVGAEFPTTERYGERDVRLSVSTDGVIYRLTADGETADGSGYAFNYTLSTLGVDSVERPDWVADAPAVVETRPTLGFENCTTPYLVVENPGPDTLPAGSVVSVTLNDTEHRATLAAALPAGERHALYLDAAGDIRTAAPDDVPADRTPMPKEAQYTVVTGGGMVLASGAGGFSCATESAGGSEAEAN